MFKHFAFFKNHLLCFLTGLVMIATVFIFIKDSVLMGDDIWLGFLGDLKYICLTPEHGRFLQSLQMKTLCYYIPSLFHIHPNSMYPVYAMFIGLNITLVSLMTALFGFIGQKKDKMLSLITGGFFLFYFKLLLTGESEELRLLSFNFAYVFGLAMFLGFLLIFGEILFSQNKFSKKTIFLCSVFSFLAGLNDTYAYIGIISIFFAFCVSVLTVLKQTLKNHDFSGNFKYFCKKNRDLIYISLCFVAGGIISISTTVTIESSRFIEHNFVYSLSNFYNSFLPQFTQACILQHRISIVVLLLLFTVICIKFNKNLKLLFYPIFVTVGVFGFFLILFFGGIENFYEAGKYWIWHKDLQTNLTVILIAINFALWGFLKTKTGDYKLFNTMMAIFICSSFFALPKITKVYTLNKKTSRIDKKTMYIAEKMYLFYTYNNETAILPISALKGNIASTFYLLTDIDDLKEENDFSLVWILENVSWDDKNEYNSAEQKAKKILFSQTYFRTVYIPKIYNISEEKCVNYKFDDDNTAMKIFNKKGGIFTDQELQNLNFTKLKDKNFVLNKTE